MRLVSLSSEKLYRERDEVNKNNKFIAASFLHPRARI
jgi:hypothetical protein